MVCCSLTPCRAASESLNHMQHKPRLREHHGPHGDDLAVGQVDGQLGKQLLREEDLRRSAARCLARHAHLHADVVPIRAQKVQQRPKRILQRALHRRYLPRVTRGGRQGSPRAWMDTLRRSRTATTRSSIMPCSSPYAVSSDSTCIRKPKRGSSFSFSGKSIRLLTCAVKAVSSTLNICEKTRSCLQ